MITLTNVVFAEGNTRGTLSHRIYPTAVLKEAVEKLDTLVGGFTGQDKFYETSETPAEDITHKCYNFRMDGDHAICDVDVLDTPKGLMLQNIMKDHESKLSIRGTGLITDDGIVTELTIEALDAGLV